MTPAACARDEQAMLTPKSALKLMLGAWQKQDWEALTIFPPARGRNADTQRV